MNLPALAASQNCAVSGLVTGVGYFLASAITRAPECRLRPRDARREVRRCRARSRCRSSSPAPRMGFAAQLPHGLEDFRHAAAVDGMIAAETAAVGVERQLADAGDQISVGDELAALALLAETEVFDLHQHRDGEAVIDRSVFDILRRHA